MKVVQGTLMAHVYCLKATVLCPDNIVWRLQIEQKKRDKAKRAASKEEHIKPLFGEDGKARTMLDKYDEEEDTGMEIDESGAFNSDKAKQQAEIRAKLAAGLSSPAVIFALLLVTASVR